MGDWWDYGSQANAEANACAANQVAQGDQFFGVRRDATTAEAIERALLSMQQGLCSVAGHETRIAELEAENAKLKEQYDNLRIAVLEAQGEAEDLQYVWMAREDAQQRANALADECGRLRDENTQLLAENARLRRGKR